MNNQPVRWLRRRKVKTLLLVLIPVGLLFTGGLTYQDLRRPDKLETVVPGKLYRSEQPKGMAFAVMQDLGIKRVISVRGYNNDPQMLAEEIEACTRAGVDFVHISITDQVPPKPSVKQFMEAVRTAPGPVLVHCEHGRSRTGMMLAAYRVLAEGWTVEDAIEDQLFMYYRSANAEQVEGLTKLLTQLKAETEADG